MKFVNLRGPAYVNGALRHPHEGTLHLTNDEADRLIKEDLADDVNGDFSESQDEEAPAETVSAPGAGASPTSKAGEDDTTKGKAKS